MAYGTDDGAGHSFLVHQKRVTVTIVEEVGVDKPGPDIGDGNVEFAHGCQLIKRLEVGVLKGFGCGIGRSCAKTFGTGNAADGSKVTTTVGGKIIESQVYHLSEAQGVSAYCVHFDS